MTVDRNILPGMKPTRHSFRCGLPLGPGVAHHGMRNLVHHAQAHVASPRGERLPVRGNSEVSAQKAKTTVCFVGYIVNVLIPL